MQRPRPPVGRHAGHADGAVAPAFAQLPAKLGQLPAKLGLRPAEPGTRSWLDVVLVVWLAWVFDAINNLGAVRQRLAESHGAALLDLERALHLAPELGLNTWLAGHRLMTDVVVFWYENAHGTVTFGLIAWLWWRRPDLLAAPRAALVATNLIGQAVFWTWPVAPPRMLASPRFLDLVAVVHGESPHWPIGGVSLDANQLSALPSLHIAWAVWSAIVLWRLCPWAPVRAFAVVYPILTSLAVMTTANHYLADVVAGALLAGAAVAAADRIWARRVRAARPAPSGGSRHARCTRPGRG